MTAEPCSDADLPTLVRAMLEDPDGVLAATRRSPAEIDTFLELDAADQTTFLPLFDPQSIAAAVLDAHGTVRAASSLFAAEHGERYIDTNLCDRALKSSRPIVAPVAIEGDAASEPAVYVYASTSVAVPLWHLPPELMPATRDGRVVVLTTLAPRAEPIERACAAFNLSGLETRVVRAVSRTGSIKAAAAELGISHITARQALTDVYRQTGAKRLPELVWLLSGLAFGLLPSEANRAALLVDLWGLSERQASIALLVASGASREEAARTLELSVAVVRKELEQIFAIFEVTSASGLTRAVATMSAVSALLAATRGTLGPADPRAEPLRLMPRADGSRIAWSDYGPATGKPVLIVHSSMTTRLAPPGLVAALQDAGYRVLAVDRPGFGMTDPITGKKAGAHDPFDSAAEDFMVLAKALRLKSTDIVARGGAQFVLALKRRAPDLVGRVVLVNPDPHSAADGRRHGPIGAFKEAYLRRPELIRLFARILAGSLTRERVHRMIARALSGSRPDETAAADTTIADEYYRSVRMFATGRIEGYVNEQVAFAQGQKPTPIPRLTNWTVLIGDHDTMHDPDNVERYWRDVLPDSHFIRVADAGRFLAMTHPARVALSLVEAGTRRGQGD